MALESAAKVIKNYFNAAFFLLPFNSLYPIRLYLSLATSWTIYRDGSTHRKVFLLCPLFLLVNLLKTIYLSVFLPANPLDRIRLADYMYIVTGENFTYQIWIPLQAMLLYFIYTLLTVKPVFLRLIENCLFSKAQPLLVGINQKSRSPLKNVKQSALFTRNAIGFLLPICDFLFFIVCATILKETIAHLDEFLGNPLVSPLLFIWRALQVIVGLAGFIFALFSYATVCPNVAAVGCATLTLLLLRLHFNAKQLTAWRASLGRHFTWTGWYRYRTYSLQTFSLLFIANQVFGRLFVAFTAVNLPISAYCSVFLALGGLTLKTTLTFIVFMLQGLVCTLPIHWFLARLTKRFHAPSKALILLCAHTGHRMGNFRARLTLHLSICHLHTAKKYGFTYGPFGLVTMGSFGKCMLIYSELILYSYKLIKGI